MRFWDSSALLALLVSQERSANVRELYAGDDQALAWSLSDVELRSGLARLERSGAMSAESAREAALRAERLWETLHIVTLVDAVKARAKRLLGVHPLRAADALQLGAALAATFDEPLGVEFVCLDARLTEAARREGFTIRP